MTTYHRHSTAEIDFWSTEEFKLNYTQFMELRDMLDDQLDADELAWIAEAIKLEDFEEINV